MEKSESFCYVGPQSAGTAVPQRHYASVVGNTIHKKHQEEDYFNNWPAQISD